MGQHHLLDQMDVGRVADLHQHDRQVTGQALAPQAGLASPVAGQQCSAGAQAGIGVEHRGGHLLEEPGVGQRAVKLVQ